MMITEKHAPYLFIKYLCVCLQGQGRLPLPQGMAQAQEEAQA
jgi:hypothetical protein